METFSKADSSKMVLFVLACTPLGSLDEYLPDMVRLGFV